MEDRAALDRYLAELRQTTEEALGRVLATPSTPAQILEPVRYSLMGPGKRLRPCLTLAVADTVAAPLGLPLASARLLALPGACAVEMVHSYSLVHDDLPAMDNDALRRGRPTTHIVHGDGLAILAGDALLTDAFDVLASSPSRALPPGAPVAGESKRLRAVAVMAEAAGSRGMVGGQAIDLALVGRAVDGASALSATALGDMHARKTGALIRAASVLGAILPGASEATVDAIDRYAADLGLAFQIVDDVLDVEGSAAALGKTAGKDAASGKPTFPALYGLERSKQMAAECIARAEAALETAGLTGRLADIARWSLVRRT
jgi:geranylgeranyl pyrophosphate synthase